MGRIARGRLSFERSGPGTALAEAYAETPMCLVTPRGRGATAWAVTGALGGGLVDGDSLNLSVALGPGARACVRTQGPTRVFRGKSASEASLQLAEGATLVLAPDPVACFSGARFEQRTGATLAPGASLLFWEILSAGRDGWGFSRFRSALCVRRAGRTLLDEATLLDAAHGPLAERLGRFQALGTLFISGLPELRASLRAAIEAAPLPRGARVLSSFSALDEETALVRLAAASVEELQAALRAHLAALPLLLGDSPWRRDAPLAA